MPSALVTLPDGRKARVTYETEDQLNTVVNDLIQQQSGVEKVGQFIRGVPRQVALGGRYMAEGAGQIADLALSPYRLGIGAIQAADAALTGRPPGPVPSVAQAITETGNYAGVPNPETPTERVVADASRLLAGTGTMAGVAQAAAPMLSGTARGAAELLAANPGAQAASAVGAGTAGGSVREAGGSAWEQFLASLAAGIAAPLALAKGQQVVQSASSAIKQALSPKEVAGEVQIAFERAGVNWGSLSEKARTQLVDDAQAAVYSGQQLDDAAMRRLADYRAIGAQPLVGDVTQNPTAITQQRNLGKQQANMKMQVGTSIAETENQNAKRVLSTLDEAVQSPADSYATGQAAIGRVQSVDEALKGKENQLYAAARESAGQEIPLQRGDFVNRAFNDLHQANATPFLPAQIREVLNDLQKGTVKVNGVDVETPFNVKTVDNLKTMLATASRSGDGNSRRAIAIVRNALEDTQPETVLPRVGGSQVTTGAQAQALDQARELPAEALKLLDRARRFARVRRDWQESLPFIEDALGGATPDKFVQKHIISGSVEDLAGLRKLAGGDPALREAVRTQLVGYIKQRGNADSDVTRFSSKGMEDALKALGDRKLTMWFKPAELNQIKSAVRVAKYMQAQPIGSAVNNSNSAATVIAKVFDSLLKLSTSVPVVGPLVGEPITNATVSLQARQVQNVGKGLTVPRTRQPLPVGAIALGAGIPPGDKRKSQ